MIQTTGLNNIMTRATTPVLIPPKTPITSLKAAVDDDVRPVPASKPPVSTPVKAPVRTPVKSVPTPAKPTTSPAPVNTQTKPNPVVPVTKPAPTVQTIGAGTQVIKTPVATVVVTPKPTTTTPTKTTTTTTPKTTTPVANTWNDNPNNVAGPAVTVVAKVLKNKWLILLAAAIGVYSIFKAIFK